MLKSTRDDETLVARALAALAPPRRLRAFRTLVVAGPEGLAAGAIGERLGLAPSALSFHLKALAHAGLVSAEPRGRFLVDRASFTPMNGLLAYLTRRCCEGQGCEAASTRDAGTCC